jgi:hypothetical protein
MRRGALERCLAKRLVALRGGTSPGKGHRRRYQFGDIVALRATLKLRQVGFPLDRAALFLRYVGSLDPDSEIVDLVRVRSAGNFDALPSGSCSDDWVEGVVLSLAELKEEALADLVEGLVSHTPRRPRNTPAGSAARKRESKPQLKELSGTRALPARSRSDLPRPVARTKPDARHIKHVRRRWRADSKRFSFRLRHAPNGLARSHPQRCLSPNRVKRHDNNGRHKRQSLCHSARDSDEPPPRPKELHSSGNKSDGIPSRKARSQSVAPLSGAWR